MSSRVEAEVALLVDVGSAWAKASAIGRVRGRWRVVAHAAQPTAWGGAELHRTLVDQLARAVDSRLRQRLDGLVAEANRIECHTARRPGRLAVVGVSRELSGNSARRAAEAAGWRVVELVTLDDGRPLAERLATIQGLEVDAWLVTGGFDGSTSPRAMEAAALVGSARRPGGGPVVWAGSVDLADEVASLFEPDVTSAVPNVRPDARRENLTALREHLRALLRTIAPGDEGHLTAGTLPRTIRALATESGMRVLAVDLGARVAIRAAGHPDGTVTSRVHARGGLSGLATVPGAAARVARVAADAGGEASVADLLQTLRARPSTVPQSPEELAATQAAASVQVAALLDDGGSEPVDLLIGCGRTIAAAPHPGQAARILLDGARPVGVTQLATDPAGVLGPLGSLPEEEIREGLTLLGDDVLVPLGTAIVSRGGDPGRLAMRVAVHRAGWPDPRPIEVRTGQLHVVPLAPGQRAELTIEPGDGVTLGGARRSPRVHALATGGSVGLILDARGVPIALPRRGDDRRAVIASWREMLRRDQPFGPERFA